jgi:hypothetical protein
MRGRLPSSDFESGAFHTNTVAGSTGHGFTAKKEEYQQTDFNDHGR